MMVEAAGSETLPMSMLLGTDVPELTDLLESELYGWQKQEETSGKDVLLVTTRAQAKHQQQEEDSQMQRELQSGVQVKPLDSGGVIIMC